MHLLDDLTLRPGNAIRHTATGAYFEIESIDAGRVKLYAPDKQWRYLDEYQAIPLTREILRGRLGFEVHDLGDYWQCEKSDFILIQLKLEVIKGREMPFTFVIKSSLKGSVSFKSVHDLQNTYLDLKQEILVFQLESGTQVTNQ